MDDDNLFDYTNPPQVERITVEYVCNNGHMTPVEFAFTTKTEIPNQWDCKFCGLTALKEGSEHELNERRSRKKYAADKNPAFTMTLERRLPDTKEAKAALDAYRKGDVPIPKKFLGELDVDLAQQLKRLRAGELKRASMI